MTVFVIISIQTKREDSSMATINYLERHLKTYKVTSHKHSYWEIIYVTEGSGQIITEDNQVFPYAQGDTICIPPSLTHKNLSSEGMKNIHFTLDGWMPGLTKVTILPASPPTSDFYRILKIAYKYFHSLPIQNSLNLALSTTLVSFLNILIKDCNISSSTQIIRNEIIDNYTDPDFDIDVAFSKVPISKERARKKFVEELNITPIQYLRQQRIELAKQLLLQKAINASTIQEVALSCGFSDSAYFSRIFKLFTGVSPNQYQLQFLADNKIY